MKRLLTIVAAGAGICALGAAAPAMEAGAARQVLEQYEEAVVTLEVVLDTKMSYGGQQEETEQKTEEMGFFIAEDGLLVTSLSNLDPAGQFYSRMSPDEGAYTTTVKEITIILAGGEELDAQLVLRDPDLDLAFLRPAEPRKQPFAYIPLEEAGTAETFDSLIALERAGRIARRTILGKMGTMIGKVDRPRTFYIPSQELQNQNTGAPVFGPEGKLLGIRTLYVFPGGQRSLGETDQPAMIVILPAEDIASIADQASEAEPEEAAAPQKAAPEEAATE